MGYYVIEHPLDLMDFVDLRTIPYDGITIR